MSDLELWPRIKSAVNAATVSRFDVEELLPTCHRRNCHLDHGDIDQVFALFAKSVLDSIHRELMCRAVTEPDYGDEETA